MSASALSGVPPQHRVLCVCHRGRALRDAHQLRAPGGAGGSGILWSARCCPGPEGHPAMVPGRGGRRALGGGDGTTAWSGSIRRRLGCHCGGGAGSGAAAAGRRGCLGQKLGLPPSPSAASPSKAAAGRSGGRVGGSSFCPHGDSGLGCAGARDDGCWQACGGASCV